MARLDIWYVVAIGIAFFMSCMVSPNGYLYTPTAVVLWPITLQLCYWLWEDYYPPRPTNSEMLVTAGDRITEQSDRIANLNKLNEALFSAFVKIKMRYSDEEPIDSGLLVSVTN